MQSVETFEQSFSPHEGGEIKKSLYKNAHVCVTIPELGRTWSITVVDGELVVFRHTKEGGSKLL